MREHTIRDMVFEIKGHTKKDFKKLKLDKYGYDFYNGFTGAPKGKEYSECVQYFLDVSVAKDAHRFYDDLTPGETTDLYLQCIAETWGSKDEEKNLSKSGKTRPGKGA